MVVYRLPRSDTSTDSHGSNDDNGSAVVDRDAMTEPKEESREELLLHSVIALSDEVRTSRVM
jgi:hypothetical protein